MGPGSVTAGEMYFMLSIPESLMMGRRSAALKLRAAVCAGNGTVFGVLSIINMVLWGMGGFLSFCLMGWGMRVFRGRDNSGAPAAAAALAGATPRRGRRAGATSAA